MANHHQPSSQSGDRALLVSLGSLVVPTSEVSAFEVLHRSTIPVFSSPWDRLDLTISLCPHCPLLFLSLPSRTWPISRIGLSIQQLNTSPVLSSSYEPAFLTLHTSFDQQQPLLLQLHAHPFCSKIACPIQALPSPFMIRHQFWVAVFWYCWIAVRGCSRTKRKIKFQSKLLTTYAAS